MQPQMTENLRANLGRPQEAVWQFWFGGDQHVNYKTKWFPEGSSALQTKADLVVNEKFGYLLTDALDGKLADWRQELSSCVALIIVLDQFSRHIHRHYGRGKLEVEERQQRADAMALEISCEFHSKYALEVLNLSMQEYIFSLMPYRHTATVEHLSLVLRRLEEKEALETKSAELLQRFRKQTVRRLQHLQDRAKLEASDDILERHAFQADESDILQHPLVRTTELFLQNHLLHMLPSQPAALSATTRTEDGRRKGNCAHRNGHGSSNGGDKRKDSDNPAGSASYAPRFTLLISLSGGVDSMVISKILCLLQKHRPYLRIREVVAIHIDYGNRPESAREATYVAEWCQRLQQELQRQPQAISSSSSSSSSSRESQQQQQEQQHQKKHKKKQEYQGDQDTTTSSTHSSDSTTSSLPVSQRRRYVCKTRRVDEVTRGVTDRTEYEKIARDIRYGFYQSCRQECIDEYLHHHKQQQQQQQVPAAYEKGPQEDDGGNNSRHGEAAIETILEENVEEIVSGVIFGHHLGDVQENVISNVMRGCWPLQLSGMTECSTSNGVAVWRPLLRHVKEEIYEFAHKYGVPYFKDSTPSWSTRGKLRNKLVPLLVDMYGAGCLQNLANLAHESDVTNDLVHNNLYKPFLASVDRFAGGLKVNILPFLMQPHCFWREALKLLMHSMSMSMIRDKAVGNFVERLQKLNASSSKLGAGIMPGWLELRKGFHTFLTAAGDLLILRDGVLRSTLTTFGAISTPMTRNQQRLRYLKQQKAAIYKQEQHQQQREQKQERQQGGAGEEAEEVVASPISSSLLLSILSKADEAVQAVRQAIDDLFVISITIPHLPEEDGEGGAGGSGGATPKTTTHQNLESNLMESSDILTSFTEIHYDPCKWEILNKNYFCTGTSVSGPATLKPASMEKHVVTFGSWRVTHSLHRVLVSNTPTATAVLSPSRPCSLVDPSTATTKAEAAAGGGSSGSSGSSDGVVKQPQSSKALLEDVADILTGSFSIPLLVPKPSAISPKLSDSTHPGRIVGSSAGESGADEVQLVPWYQLESLKLKEEELQMHAELLSSLLHASTASNVATTSTHNTASSTAALGLDGLGLQDAPFATGTTGISGTSRPSQFLSGLLDTPTSSGMVQTVLHQLQEVATESHSLLDAAERVQAQMMSTMHQDSLSLLLSAHIGTSHYHDHHRHQHHQHHHHHHHHQQQQQRSFKMSKIDARLRAGLPLLVPIQICARRNASEPHEASAASDGAKAIAVDAGEHSTSSISSSRPATCSSTTADTRPSASHSAATTAAAGVGGADGAGAAGVGGGATTTTTTGMDHNCEDEEGSYFLLNISYEFVCSSIDEYNDQA